MEETVPLPSPSDSPPPLPILHLLHRHQAKTRDPNKTPWARPGSRHTLGGHDGAREGAGLQGHAWPLPHSPHLPPPSPDTCQERQSPQGRPWPLPGLPAPRAPPTPGPALPASHLRFPARQARPPPEREASRCSLMARAGERSHHGGGPTGPRPAGPGSRGPWRCSMVGEPAVGAWEGAWEASVSARRLGTRQTAEFPFPRTARPPTLAQTPVTTGRSHWPKPRAA